MMNPFGAANADEDTSESPRILSKKRFICFSPFKMPGTPRAPHTDRESDTTRGTRSRNFTRREAASDVDAEAGVQRESVEPVSLVHGREVIEERGDSSDEVAVR